MLKTLTTAASGSALILALSLIPVGVGMTFGISDAEAQSYKIRPVRNRGYRGERGLPARDTSGYRRSTRTRSTYRRGGNRWTYYSSGNRYRPAYRRSRGGYRTPSRYGRYGYGGGYRSSYGRSRSGYRTRSRYGRYGYGGGYRSSYGRYRSNATRRRMATYRWANRRGLTLTTRSSRRHCRQLSRRLGSGYPGRVRYSNGVCSYSE